MIIYLKQPTNDAIKGSLFYDGLGGMDAYEINALLVGKIDEIVLDEALFLFMERVYPMQWGNWHMYESCIYDDN